MKIILCDKEKLTDKYVFAEPIDFRNINKKSFDIITNNYVFDNVIFYHLKIEDISNISKMKNLINLKMNWATKISDLHPIQNLKNLRDLIIEDFPKVYDLSFLSSMRLNSLKLSGSTTLSNVMKIKSIEPITKIIGLRKLELLNLKIDDNDITKLANIKTLKKLKIANVFETEQFAFLAAKLNEQLDKKIESYYKTNIDCESCNFKKVMITGKRKPFLCPGCDKERFEKYVKNFQKLVNKYD